MWVSNLLAGGLLLVLGILVRVFNLSFLIAGYNTSSPEKKAKVNERALTRFVGMMLITAGAVLLLGGIFAWLNVAPLIIVPASWVLFFAVMVFGLIYVNGSVKFKNQK